MIHPTPTKTLLTTTFAPLVMQRSGLLARGTRLLDRFVHAEPIPETTMAFERERSALLREVGRRIMAWPLNRLEPDADSEAPSRGLFEGRLSRRRRKHPHVVGTLFGPVTLWRRLYEPRGHRGHSMHPLELRLGIEAGLATPALAERVGAWSTDHTPHEVLEIVQRAHGVSWACTSLRKVLGKLRTGMAPQREGAQGKQVLSWIEQARASTGRLRPTLSVGRDGILVPLRGGVAQEGATATVSVLARRGKRVGTASLGQMPASGQGTLTDQLSRLLQAMLSQGESQLLRLVSVSDEGHHPRTSYHQVLKKMVDPRRPGRRLEWRRIVAFSQACGYVQQLADTIFGAGDEAQNWAKEMRHVLKTKADGVTRVLKSASAWRRRRGLHGQATLSHQAYRYIKTRTQWMRYHSDQRQRLPRGSGITEAACKVVFTQRLKRSGMAWTIAGGQGILDLRVIRLSGVWDAVHQRYLASKPLPVACGDTGKVAQHRPLAA